MPPGHSLDVAIIGGGPAGLAAAQVFHREGLAYRVLEKGPIAHHIAQYPTFMRFFSTNDNLEIAGFPLGITEEKPSRREYLKYLTDFARFHRLNVETYAPVGAVTRGPDGWFDIRIDREGCPPESVRARAVVLAVGAWDSPRRLGVPGDELSKVHYRYTEPHNYVGKRVLVVGGRNSAVETALQLWRAGAKVSLSYRRTEFNGVGLKYWLKPDIENRLKNGEIAPHLGTTVARIDWDSVDLTLASGKTTTIENDFVLPMLGYDPPAAFLRNLGVQLAPDSNRPHHNADTLETNVPGLFVAGVILHGNISGHVFIENSRHHGEMILPRLREILAVAA